MSNHSRAGSICFGMASSQVLTKQILKKSSSITINSSRSLNVPARLGCRLRHECERESACRLVENEVAPATTYFQ